MKVGEANYSIAQTGATKEEAAKKLQDDLKDLIQQLEPETR